MKKLTLVLALALMAGCSTVTTLTPTVTEVVACDLATHNPAAQRWLNLVGEVFVEFSGDTLPTPAQLEARLTSIQAFGLSAAEQKLVWGGFAVVYAQIYRPNLPLEKQDQIRDLFQKTGLALKAGAKCAVDTIQQARWLEPINLRPVTDNIAAQFKKL